jgi:hypothetical protein
MNDHATEQKHPQGLVAAWREQADVYNRRGLAARQRQCDELESEALCAEQLCLQHSEELERALAAEQSQGRFQCAKCHAEHQVSEKWFTPASIDEKLFADEALCKCSHRKVPDHSPLNGVCVLCMEQPGDDYCKAFSPSIPDAYAVPHETEQAVTPDDALANENENCSDALPCGKCPSCVQLMIDRDDLDHPSNVTQDSIRCAIEAIKEQGPCLVCGIEGEYAAHRLIDSEIGMLAAGETLDAILDWFHKPEETTISAMLSRWIALAVIKAQQPEAGADPSRGISLFDAIGRVLRSCDLRDSHGCGELTYVVRDVMAQVRLFHPTTEAEVDATRNAAYYRGRGDERKRQHAKRDKALDAADVLREMWKARAKAAEGQLAAQRRKPLTTDSSTSNDVAKPVEPIAITEKQLIRTIMFLRESAACWGINSPTIAERVADELAALIPRPCGRCCWPDDCEAVQRCVKAGQ